MRPTLDGALEHLADAAHHALRGEPVFIIVGADTLRLSPEVPLRPPGYFVDCYQDTSEAEFEDRLCRDPTATVDP